jgi:uncharacterized membrane protein
MALSDYRTLFVGEGNVIFYIVVWLWFVGGNMMISGYRWRRFVRRCIREAADRVYISMEHLMANKREQN